jgi:hypothetical protein
MNIFDQFSLVWKRFTPAEEQVLQAVREVLPQEAIPTFDAQVTAINLVRRHLNWDEVLFYRKIGRMIDWGETPMFPRKEKFCLASVSFSTGTDSCSARLTCVSGHIFSLKFSPPSKDRAFRQWVRLINAQIESNPLAKVEEIEEHIPSEWKRLASELRTSRSSQWNIYDAISAQRVVIDGEEFVLLGENSKDLFILSKPGTENGQLYQMTHDGKPEAIQDVDSILIL